VTRTTAAALATAGVVSLASCVPSAPAATSPPAPPPGMPATVAANVDRAPVAGPAPAAATSASADTAADTAAGTAADTAAGTAAGSPPWTPGVWEAPPADVEPWGVWIPRLGVSATLTQLGLEDDGRLEVPGDEAMAGWYVGGPRPGETGPAVVAGHVDSRTGPAVFARLSQLAAGDVAHVVYRDGFVATFRISAVQRHAKDAFPTAAVYGDVAEPALRLITCGGSFDRGSGSYRDNVVAFGEILGTWRYDPGSGG
jgi:hypothetical protein